MIHASRTPHITLWEGNLNMSKGYYRILGHEDGAVSAVDPVGWMNPAIFHAKSQNLFFLDHRTSPLGPGGKVVIPRPSFTGVQLDYATIEECFFKIEGFVYDLRYAFSMSHRLWILIREPRLVMSYKVTDAMRDAYEYGFDVRHHI